MIDSKTGAPPQPVFFWGVVEDIKDPEEKRNRVKVRCIGFHSAQKTASSTQGIATEDLVWAEVAMPTTGASVSGVGVNHGLVQGSFVMGLFRDGPSAQRPVVCFSFSGAPLNPADPELGFNDPDGVYPREDRLEESDVNRLARGNLEESWVTTEREKLETGIGEGGWDEPDIEYSAEYPHNQVHEWPGGIIEEHDSTLDFVRWNRYHPAGTWEQWDSQGNRHAKIAGNDTLVVEGSGTVYVKGEITIIADGNVNLEAEEVKWRGRSLAQIESDLIKLGIDADEPVALGASLLEYIANHIHNTSQGPSDKPVVPPKKDLLSDKVQVE